MPHATSKCENYLDFVDIHKGQLESSAIPEIYWKSLFHKLKNEVYDAGECFMIQQVQHCDEEEEYSDEDEIITNGQTQSMMGNNGLEDVGGASYTWQVVVVKEDGIKKSDPQSVFLVDHAWTYRVDQARKQLEAIPSLRQRMSHLMDINTDGRSVEQVVEGVLQAMWRFNLTYNLGNTAVASEEACPIWYIMDEFGCRIQHADSPSVKMCPFFYSANETAYTIMWPIHDLAHGDELTRDYAVGVTNMLTRKLRLLPWQPADMTHLSIDLQEAESDFFAKYQVHETLPDPNTEAPVLPQDRNIRVYTDYALIRSFLDDPRFEITDSKEDADILWISETIRNFLACSVGSQKSYINQFPFEMVVTIKNMLATVARRVVKKHINHDTLEVKPDWLPVTFNLSSELPQFVSFFQQRERKGLSNNWICKPWNLGRGFDIHITENLNHILRLPDTGPKIASLYVDDPVLIERQDVGHVKFDLRFVVMLASVKPLSLYIYKKFLIRYANISYSLDHFDEYEKHFTVMNCKKDADVHEVHCEDFIQDFEQQYPDLKWNEIEGKIHDIIKLVFEAATAKPAPLGIGHSVISRALYGMDILLKWTTDNKGARQVTPVLIECNFGPNNVRFCKFYPGFMNDVFSTLFLNDTEGREVKLL